MTIKEMAALVGRTGLYGLNGLKVGVRVLDVRTRYGYTDYLIRPLHGEGEKWAEAAYVELDEIARPFSAKGVGRG